MYKRAEKSVGLKARNAFVEKMLGEDPDSITDDFASELWDSYEDFAQTVPTTLAGLQAMLVFAYEVAEQDADVLNEAGIFATLATAAKALIGKPA